MISVEEYLNFGRHKEINDYYNTHGINKTAKTYGISRSRVYQIIDTYKRRYKLAQKRELNGLPDRIYNALARAGIKTTEELQEFYRDYGITGLQSLKHIGEESAIFIAKYLGD